MGAAIHIFKVGPIPVVGAYNTLFAAAGQKGLQAKLLLPDERGGLRGVLDALLEAGHPKEALSVEPALEQAGKRLGLRSAPLPPFALEQRVLATVQVLLERDSESKIPWEVVQGYTQAFQRVCELSEKRLEQLREGMIWAVVSGEPAQVMRVALGDGPGPSVNVIEEELRSPRDPPAVVSQAFPDSGWVMGALQAGSESVAPWSEAIFRDNLGLEHTPMLAAMRADQRHPVSVWDVALATAVMRACAQEPAEPQVTLPIEGVPGSPSLSVYFPLHPIAGPADALHKVVGLFTRDEPCPCGAGGMLRTCHGHYPVDGPLIGGEAAFFEKAVWEHATEHLGDDWLLAARHLGVPAPDPSGERADLTEMQRPWATRDLRVEGTTALESYLQARGNRGAPREIAYHQQSRLTWPSYLRVTARVDQALDLQDILTGQTWARVELGRDGRDLPLGSVIFAYVGRWQGKPAIFDAHFQALSPAQAALAERAVRSLLPTPTDGALLRESGAGYVLDYAWQIPARDAGAMPPAFSDDDWMAVGHATYDIKRQREIAGGLAEALPPLPLRNGELLYLYAHPQFKGGEPRPIVGMLQVGPGWIRALAKTNQAARALAKASASTVGKLVKNAPADEVELLRKASSTPPWPRPVVAVVHAYKRLFYAAWPDRAQPELDGLTARQALVHGTADQQAAVKRATAELQAWEDGQVANLRVSVAEHLKL